MPSIRIGASGIIDAALWIRNRLSDFNVPQPAGNRLMKACTLLQDANQRKILLRPDDEKTLYEVTEAQWTVLEHYVVAHALGAKDRTLPPILLDKLETMLSGADTEEDDKNPLARNTQFELYVGATLVMGGVQTWLYEPDLQIDYLGSKIGVAAKRVRSARQLIKRAKDAAIQIRKSGLPGIVAMNVDVLLRKTGMGDLGTEQLDERLAALKMVDNLLSKYEEVLASLVFARDAVWQFSGEKPSIELAIWYRFVTYPRSQKQREFGEEFWRRVRERIDERMANI